MRVIPEYEGKNHGMGKSRISWLMNDALRRNIKLVAPDQNVHDLLSRRRPDDP